MATDPDILESRLIWIFGSGRSGSSWLLRLLGHHPRTVPINETGFGEHLADVRTRPGKGAALEFFRYNDLRADTPDYCFADEYAEVWRPLTRKLILGRLDAQVAPEAERWSIDDPRVVIKEPNGSMAADLILSILPRAGLLYLIRDGRDVVDSALAASLGDSWAKKFGGEIRPEQRRSFVRHRASMWVGQMKVVTQAFEAHDPARRIQVRYEDLLADTAGVLSGILTRFGLELEQGELERTVATEAFDAIPPARRGPTQPARAASPGLWRENLLPEEQDEITEIMGETLAGLGYEA